VFASEVMLVNKLDGREPRSYHAVFAPLYAAVGVMGAFGASLLYYNMPGDGDDDGANDISSSKYII
jgi:hypothetical protein